MNKDIHICFCSDENLIEHIPTVLNSIQSKNAHHTIIIHFIHCIMNLNLLEQLQQFINNFKNMKLHCYYKTWDYNYVVKLELLLRNQLINLIIILFFNSILQNQEIVV